MNGRRLRGAVVLTASASVGSGFLTNERRRNCSARLSSASEVVLPGWCSLRRRLSWTFDTFVPSKCGGSQVWDG